MMFKLPLYLCVMCPRYSITASPSHSHLLLSQALGRNKSTVRIFAVLFILLGLSACATKPTLETQQVLQLNHNLDTLKQWKIKGKIAWISSDKRQSAYLNWQQNNEDMNFTLTNVLGINLASMSYNGKLAVLEADSKRYEDSSASRLIRQTTGWEIPVEELKNWVKGAVNATGRVNANATNHQDSANHSVLRFENGLVKQLITQCTNEHFNCNPWQIDYKSYKTVTIKGTEFQLPTDISVRNLKSKALIKIKVSEWS